MQQGTRSTVLPATHLDALTLCHTAFHNFRGLLNAAGGYSPSLRTESASSAEHRRELTDLADGYDKAQAARGDSRRAFRS